MSPILSNPFFLILTWPLYSDQKEGVGAFFEKRKPNFRANLDDNPPVHMPWWTEVDTGRAPKAKSKASSKL
jgi:hypothetical protein